MEYSTWYFYIFLFMFAVFFLLMVLYAVYLVQQRVMSAAVTSADVIFFPMRFTAVVIRTTYHVFIFGFDVTLNGMRLALVCCNWVLVVLEKVLTVYQFPVILMITVIQKLRRWRKKAELKVQQKEMKTKHKLMKGKHSDSESDITEVSGNVNGVDSNQISGVTETDSKIKANVEEKSSERGLKSLIGNVGLSLKPLGMAKDYVRNRVGDISSRTLGKIRHSE